MGKTSIEGSGYDDMDYFNDVLRSNLIYRILVGMKNSIDLGLWTHIII